MLISDLYKHVTKASEPLLIRLLQSRLRRGKEDPERWLEKTGQASLPRPDGPLLWLHAASVGESVSALILIERILSARPDLSILVTTGTRTSAATMKERLPERAVHQYAPLDHPGWTARFLDHWRPDLAIWMESELWPNLLRGLKARDIPAALVNARLSPKSAAAWKLVKREATELFSVFSICLAQGQRDGENFLALGLKDVEVTGNLKYSAASLPCNQAEYALLQDDLRFRMIVVYASTHSGEETLALRLHQRLKNEFPSLLSIIVPRHPERGAEIATLLGGSSNVRVMRRGDQHLPPEPETDLYIADTLGELGLFYRLAPVAVIGRTFSDDGGGGHNPLEAAQLGCAVLHGPKVQNLQDIFNAMNERGAAKQLADRNELFNELRRLLGDPAYLQDRRARAAEFARQNAQIIDTVMTALAPLLTNIRRSS